VFLILKEATQATKKEEIEGKALKLFFSPSIISIRDSLFREDVFLILTIKTYSFSGSGKVCYKCIFP